MSINKHIAKISRSQKKIIGFAAVIIAAFSTVWSFIYIPMKNKTVKLSGELKGVEQQIQEIENMIARNKSMGEGIRLLEERYRQLGSRFPHKEEDALTALFHLSYKANIEIVSVKSQPKRPCGLKAVIDGRSCYELPVLVGLKGAYKDMVGYIELLRESSPAFVTFEKLSIHKGGAGGWLLNVSMDIKLYLLI